MEKTEYEDFINILSKHKLNESDFEIKEKKEYPPHGSIGPLYNELTIKHKKSNTCKTYRTYCETWLTEFSNDLKSNYYRTRQ
ncbi:MAG: hypothetical protein JW786_06250 [Desulfobacterales bacterium]|nr:hypothetical protein [Desulfobacterales bacterium]